MPALLVALLLAVLPVMTDQPTAAAATVNSSLHSSVKSSVTRPQSSIAAPMRGERFTLSGTVRPRVKRLLRVQERRAGAWRTVSSTRSWRSGRYQVSLSGPAATRTYRVVAPRVRTGGRVLTRAVSAGRTVRPSEQQVTVTISPTSVVGRGDAVSARSLPARAGRVMDLQRRVSGAWRTHRTDTSDTSGRARFTLPAASRHESAWRVSARAFRGAPSTISPAQLGTVLRWELTGTVSRPSTSNAVVVRVDQAVHEVEIFVDAEPHGYAAQDPATANTWRFDLDPARVPAGSHTVAARLAAPGKRGITPSVSFEVPKAEQPGSGLPDGFARRTVASGLDTPTSFDLIDDRVALVAEKAGRVWLLQDGRRGDSPALDLTDRVNTAGDRGLLGIRAAPDFDPETATGWVYLAYVYNDPRRDEQDWRHTQRVTRVFLQDGRAEADDQEVLIGDVLPDDCADPATPDCIPSLGTSHNVDDLQFGPDGALYISVGDGVIYGGDRHENIRAQELDVLAGKILRPTPRRVSASTTTPSTSTIRRLHTATAIGCSRSASATRSG